MTNQDSWGTMLGWPYLSPPSRPSYFQLMKIREHCTSISKDTDVAVLGNTIEFRDLLFELGFKNIFILERNLEFYKAVQPLRIYNNQETLIHGDWLNTLDRFPNRFSIILSDLTSGNISYTHRPTFYQKIESTLTAGGIFCDKILTHSSEFLKSSELIESYKQHPPNWLYANKFNCELLFCSDLLLESQIVDTTKFYGEIENRGNHPVISRFVKMCKLITPPGFIWYYGKPWEELSTDYCPNLTCVEGHLEIEESNPYRNRLRYMFLKK